MGTTTFSAVLVGHEAHIGGVGKNKNLTVAVRSADPRITFGQWDGIAGIFAELFHLFFDRFFAFGLHVTTEPAENLLRQRTRVQDLRDV